MTQKELFLGFLENLMQEEQFYVGELSDELIRFSLLEYIRVGGKEREREGWRGREGEGERGRETVGKKEGGERQEEREREGGRLPDSGGSGPYR